MVLSVMSRGLRGHFGPGDDAFFAGGPGDLAGLEGVADRRIALGSLLRDDVVAELRRIDAAIADHLEDAELEAYADAVVADPALIDDLRAVLPLTGPAS